MCAATSGAPGAEVGSVPVGLSFGSGGGGSVGRQPATPSGSAADTAGAGEPATDAAARGAGVPSAGRGPVPAAGEAMGCWASAPAPDAAPDAGAALRAGRVPEPSEWSAKYPPMAATTR